MKTLNMSLVFINLSCFISQLKYIYIFPEFPLNVRRKYFLGRSAETAGKKQRNPVKVNMVLKYASTRGALTYLAPLSHIQKKSNGDGMGVMVLL